MAATIKEAPLPFTVPLLPPLQFLSNSESYRNLSKEALSDLVKSHFTILLESIHRGDNDAFHRDHTGWTVISELRMLNEDECAPLLLELITLVFEKKILSDRPRTSYEHLSTHVQNNQLLDTIALPYFQNLSSEALWFAIISDNLALAEQIILSGIDINTPLHTGMSPLLLACKRGHYPLVKLLLAHGANPQFIGGTHHHNTPVTALRYHSKEWVYELFKPEDIAFSNEFESRKKLTHQASSLKIPIHYTSKLMNQVLHHEGGRPRIFIQQFLDHQQGVLSAVEQMKAGCGDVYESMTKELSADVKDSLRRDPALRINLSHSLFSILGTFTHYLRFEILEQYRYVDEALSDALNRLDKNQPVICFGTTNTKGTWKETGGPNLHAWGLVISVDLTPESKGYLLQRIDRGCTDPGIICIKLTKDEATHFISNYLHAWNWKSYPEKSIELTQTIRDLTDLKHNERAQHFPLERQTAGTCCLTSFEGIVIAYLQAQFASHIDFQTANQLAQGFSDKFFLEMFDESLINYVENHFGESHLSLMPPDLILLEPAITKMNTLNKVNTLNKAPSICDSKLLAAVQPPLEPDDFLKKIQFHIKQPYIKHLLENGKIQLCFNDKTVLSKFKTIFEINTLTHADSLRSFSKLNIDRPLVFSQETLGSIRQAIPYLQSLRQELSLIPPPHSLAAFYFFLLNASLSAETEFLIPFELLSGSNQSLIRTEIKQLCPHFNDLISYELMLAATHNAVFSQYSLYQEHFKLILKKIHEIQADTLKSSLLRMPKPYLLLFNYTLLSDKRPALSESTAIFSDFESFDAITKSAHNQAGSVYKMLADLDFANPDSIFYLQLFNDRDYFSCSSFSSQNEKETTVLRHPARLALALSLWEEESQAPSKAASSSSV